MKHRNDDKVLVPLTIESDKLIPTYGSSGASGADVRANINEDLILEAGGSTLVSTGLFFEIPQGYEIQVRPRSGLALKHQITVLNTPGTIDADYRGELKVILINHGKNAFTINPGMRIAQIVLAAVVQADFVVAEALGATDRGHGGFGHTGLN
ncbi:Deoxyuridine 5'-triphosphate nucleotidohydrolase [Chlamydiales bacterium SCGC AG-110-M15]|nr:Deoxyuridine 5'-triphosphate nucleotidohydrolase [Chlamydiales bacterium SCGC AG-110-M15]